MRLLLDTHVALWWLADNPKLGPTVRELIEGGGNDVFVSSVSVAEISIKRSLGKLDAPRDILTALAEEGFEELSLQRSHATVLEHLPNHHRDPFDRMLIAQATAESLTLVTYDARVLAYDVASVTG